MTIKLKSFHALPEIAYRGKLVDLHLLLRFGYLQDERNVEIGKFLNKVLLKKIRDTYTFISIQILKSNATKKRSTVDISQHTYLL